MHLALQLIYCSQKHDQKWSRWKGYCQEIILEAGDQREKAEVNHTRTGRKISGSRFYRVIDPNGKILNQFIVIVNDKKYYQIFFPQISYMHYNLESI